jgi:macrodomain Ter protein organizer (MatP/YcbG family)
VAEEVNKVGNIIRSFKSTLWDKSLRKIKKKSIKLWYRVWSRNVGCGPTAVRQEASC